ncbi:ABC transporter permease [Pelosinus fermentans]|uniref:ABC-type transporter, integral membrane subunit n=1 Tax=Pelosinus fermentans JBW45 TaxID=1192197 RepID=I9DA47_9FIRM|nr:ABC transporter permease [Pelosinus fermentans]AJQ25705.1 ABC-type transporter, integral membrane subunit [Pelosinus fermentans JBW45]
MMFNNFLVMLQNRWPEIMIGTWEHIQLTLVALFIGNLIALPLGILLTRKRKLAEAVIGITSVFQTIPSLALLGFMIPFFGIGFGPAIVALTIYALLPILRNTYTGILGVNQAVVDAGTGMGMTSRQVLFMIEIPLALPIIMAGIRTATVMVIGVATLAALVGAGGLGDIIFRGIAMARQDLILAGAIPAALLSMIFDYILKRIEIAVQP